jgi:hypothetical protein
MEGLSSLFTTKSHDRELKKTKRGGNRPFGDVCFGDVDLIVSFDKVYFGKNSVASHALGRNRVEN